MNVIRFSVHGVLDYLVGALLLVLPWIAGFNNNGLATTLSICLGVVTLAYSLLTNYPLGAIRIVPFIVHLGLDAVSGVVLIALPYVLDFGSDAKWPLVFLGGGELLVVALSPWRNYHRRETGVHGTLSHT
jgi:hypothetical protein